MLRSFLPLAVVLSELRAAPLRAQGSLPRHGWTFGFGLGLGLGHASCDSPCHSPRARIGPQLVIRAAHTVGDRAILGFSGGGFFAASEGGRDDGWTVATPLSLEVGARPTANASTLVTADFGLGVASLDFAPHRENLPNPIQALAWTWGLRVASDDPTRSNAGSYCDAHGTFGGVAPRWAVDGAGYKVGASGFAVGAMLTSH